MLPHFRLALFTYTFLPRPRPLIALPAPRTKPPCLNELGKFSRMVSDQLPFFFKREADGVGATLLGVVVLDEVFDVALDVVFEVEFDVGKNFFPNITPLRPSR